jgi:hypothetical protein
MQALQILGACFLQYGLVSGHWEDEGQNYKLQIQEEL